MDQSLIAYFEKYLSPFLLPNNWKLKSTLLIGIITVLLASPRIHMMNEYIHSDSGLWTVIMRKSSDLTDPLKDIPAASHAAKKKLRLTVPAIAKVLHTGPWGIYLIQFILGFFSIFFFLSIIDRITANRLYSFLFAASFAFIFAGKCAFVDIAGHLDAWPFFFALLAIFTRFRLIQLISLFAVIWSDERGYILAAITCISLFVIENYGNEQESKPHKLNFGSLIPALSIPFAIALRMYLTGNYDLGTNYMDPANEVGSELLFNQIEQRFFISALMQFEGFWILFFATLVILYKQRLFFPAILFAGFLFVNTMSSFVVGDITRSGSYGFPLIFISALIITKLRPGAMWMIISLVFLVCFIIPPFQFLGENISYYSPFPLYHIYFFRQFMPF